MSGFKVSAVLVRWVGKGGPGQEAGRVSWGQTVTPSIVTE